MRDIEYRVLCPCGHRYPTKTIEGEAVCCPKCRLISPAKSEPVDEHWWAWLSVQPWYRQMMHWQPKYVAGNSDGRTPVNPSGVAGSGPAPPQTKTVTAAEKRKERHERVEGL